MLNGKPSFILSQLRNIANNQCGDEILRPLFMEHLPALHRQILAMSSSKNLNEIAQMADKITDEVQAFNKTQETFPNVATVESRNTTLELKLDAITSELADLKEKFKNSHDGRSCSKYRDNSRNRFRSSSRHHKQRNRSRSKQPNDICWYHWRFEEKCHPNKCVQPCKWEEKLKSGK